jgi:predicted RNA-binding Zn-ribbon protein involved in translation (DUF1610 family)
MMAAQCYKCPTCGWIGTEFDMEADWESVNDCGDETWSNWICPQCGAWWELEDYCLLGKHYTIEPYDEYDKDITVRVGNHLVLSVDYDDVDHTQVEDDLKKMVAILEQHWDD